MKYRSYERSYYAVSITSYILLTVSYSNTPRLPDHFTSIPWAVSSQNIPERAWSGNENHFNFGGHQRYRRNGWS